MEELRRYQKLKQNKIKTLFSIRTSNLSTLELLKGDKDQVSIIDTLTTLVSNLNSQVEKLNSEIEETENHVPEVVKDIKAIFLIARGKYFKDLDLDVK